MPECPHCRAAYEAWAGSELPSEPQAETAPEAYAYRIIKQMLEEIQKGLGDDDGKGG